MPIVTHPKKFCTMLNETILQILTQANIFQYNSTENSTVFKQGEHVASNNVGPIYWVSDVEQSIICTVYVLFLNFVQWPWFWIPTMSQLLLVLPVANLIENTLLILLKMFKLYLQFLNCVLK
jgi:hypothetical protein